MHIRLCVSDFLFENYYNFINDLSIADNIISEKYKKLFRTELNGFKTGKLFDMLKHFKGVQFN